LSKANKEVQEFSKNMLLLQQEELISFFISVYGLPEKTDEMNDDLKETIDDVHALFNQCALLSGQLNLKKMKEQYFKKQSVQEAIENVAT
jgi:hypothetical protein